MCGVNTWLDTVTRPGTIATKIYKEAVMSDTYNEVKAIIKDLLGADEAKITPEARFREDLEADSLDLVELIMAFEDKFDVVLLNDDLDNAKKKAQALYDEFKKS